MSDDSVAGSPLRLPPDDLEALAALLEALVPGKIADAPPGWSEGWRSCCLAIREVGRAREANWPPLLMLDAVLAEADEADDEIEWADDDPRWGAQ